MCDEQHIALSDPHHPVRVVLRWQHKQLSDLVPFPSAVNELLSAEGEESLSAAGPGSVWRTNVACLLFMSR